MSDRPTDTRRSDCAQSRTRTTGRLRTGRISAAAAGLWQESPPLSAATRSRWNLIVACDLPYLSAEWLDWLLSRALRSRGEAIIPRTERGIEPLAAVYRRECGAPIAAALARGVRKVSDAIEELRLDLVYPREWRRIDPSGLVLRNMNAPGDYEEARKWWAAKRPRVNEACQEAPAGAEAETAIRSSPE